MLNSIAPVIFARGGSKGLPRKNLALLGGKTLLRRAIEQVLNTGFAEVFVSTDSREIAEEARKAGGSIPFMRPQDLSGDESPEWLSWQHFCSYLQSDHPDRFTHLLVTPTTAPLRSVEDLMSVVNLISSGRWDVVVTMTNAKRHPGFNMVRRMDDERVELYDALSSRVSRRQDVDSVYDLATVAYGANVDFVMRANNMWEGRVGGFVVPEKRSVDIDTHFDLEFAQFLLGKNSGNGP